MKRFLLPCCFFIGSIFALADSETSVLISFNSISYYGAAVYNILNGYVESQPRCSSEELVECLQGAAINSIMKSAQDVGCSRSRVLRSAYAIALKQNPQKPIILEAITLTLKKYMMWKDVYYWGVLSAGVLSLGASLYGFGFYIWYFKFDHRVVSHYRANSIGGLFPREDRD